MNRREFVALGALAGIGSFTGCTNISNGNPRPRGSARLSSRPVRLTSMALSLVFMLTACGDGTTEPEPFDGTYTLRTSNGTDLPAPYAPGGPPTIQRGTLTVEGLATMRVTLGIGTTLADASDQQFTFQYQQVGDSLVVAFPTGTGGRLVGSAVRLRVGLPAPPSMGFVIYWHDLTFRR